MVVGSDHALGFVDPDRGRANGFLIEVVTKLVLGFAALETHCATHDTRIACSKVVAAHSAPLTLVLNLHPAVQ